MATLSQILGSYAYNFKYDHLPKEVIEKAKTCLLHDLGVAAASYDSEPVQVAIKAAGPIFGKGDKKEGKKSSCATVLVKGSKVPLGHAVFVNSVMFHSRTQEDTHMGALTHFGPNVIPISLALGESLHKSGREVIEAIVAGYQVGAAVGSVTAKESTAKGFRASSIYGQFGGAVAAGKLLHLREQQLAHAVSFAASFALGLNETWLAGTMDYAIQVGMAAANGLMAAMLAKEGGEAAETALEGRAGFYRAYAGVEGMRAQVEEALAKKYQIYDVTLKPFNVCAVNQSTVTTALNLLGKAPVDLKAVSKIAIRLNPVEAAYPGVNSKGPFRRYGGSLMSAQYCVATALKHKGITMGGMLEFDDPVINDLVSKGEVIADERLNPFCCVLEIETKDGRKRVEELNITSKFYDYPFDRDAELLRGILPEMKIKPRRFEKLVKEVSGLENLEDVSSIVKLLVK